MYKHKLSTWVDKAFNDYMSKMRSMIDEPLTEEEQYHWAVLISNIISKQGDRIIGSNPTIVIKADLVGFDRFSDRHINELRLPAFIDWCADSDCYVYNTRFNGQVYVFTAGMMEQVKNIANLSFDGKNKHEITKLVWKR